MPFAAVQSDCGRHAERACYFPGGASGAGFAAWPSPFVVAGSYFGTHWVDETEEKDGLRMRFTGWSFPLETLARALEDAGFLLEAIREPRPRDDEPDPRYERWRRIPFWLHLRALKP